MKRKGRREYLGDAARLIDERVRRLLAEQAGNVSARPASVLAADWSAILEAELLAKLIRHLAKAPYRGNPYEVATRRRDRLGDCGSDGSGFGPATEHKVRCPVCGQSVRTYRLHTTHDQRRAMCGDLRILVDPTGPEHFVGHDGCPGSHRAVLAKPDPET